MEFKNPSVNNNVNVDELTKKIDKLTEELNINNTMTEESLALLRDISVNLKMNNSNIQNEEIISSNNLDKESEQKKDVITFYNENDIPITTEASEGMQRIMSLKEEEINKLKSKLNVINITERSEEIIPVPIIETPDDDVISIKM